MTEDTTQMTGIEPVARGETTVSPVLCTVDDVGRMLQCSTRHVYRLCDAGKLPKPVRLGALIRWPRSNLEDWIQNGCPHCRPAGRRQQ